MRKTKAAVSVTVLMLVAGLAIVAQPVSPVFPYGAVYFRKSNPPRADWERDHKTAAKLGHNTFQHRFIWAVIEVAPGKYDWADYDRMMELAAQNNIKVVIREISNTAPEWMFDRYPHARRVEADGSVSYPSVGGSTATGEAHLCLDNDDVLAAEERFLTALVERYRDHPATMGYNLWNEFGAPECYCEATQAKFRDWLKAKYGSLEELARVWHRYSFAEWQFVHPPRRSGGYPDTFDWLEFRKDNMIELFRRRVELFRRLDKKHLVTGHGGRGGMEFLTATKDDWRAAAELDVTGYTWVASRTGNEPWKQFQVVDFTRASARGKPFWHAEAQSGPLWMQPQVVGRPREDGRISYPKDVRLWNLVSMALGTTGIFDTRWRPLLDGPLFGAFGGLGMDGSVTPQAEMGGRVARWANAHPAIWKSRPVKGEIGIVFAPESQVFNEVQHHNSIYYSESMRGAYQAFFDSNIQADFVRIDHIDEYPMVYLPYPVMLKQSSVQKLREYVENGGNLVSEGTPAYWGDGATVGTVQPNLGLDKLFGARESYVEFTPDLLDNLTLTVRGKEIGGRFYLQEYTVAGGRAVGHYANGHVAAVENTAGSGKTLLIGTFPGASYFLKHAPATREFFVDLLAWGGVEQRLRSSDREIKARLHEGEGGTYVWVVNPTRQPRTVEISLPSTFERAVELWQESSSPTVNGKMLSTTVEDQNVAVIRLE
ncbi:MAG: beta-galactosidase [Bryobacteraceae bacterium]